MRTQSFTVTAAVLCGLLSSCVHYHPQPLAPVRSETAYKLRSFNDAGLIAFVRSVGDGGNRQWPPRTLDLATASLVAAYFNPSLEVARHK